MGYRGLFPKLDGGKYPLTQTMIIELGILAAVVIVSYLPLSPTTVDESDSRLARQSSSNSWISCDTDSNNNEMKRKLKLKLRKSPKLPNGSRMSVPT